jgi:hypothetical protein
MLIVDIQNCLGLPSLGQSTLNPISYFQDFGGELGKRRFRKYACRENIFGRILKTMGFHYLSVIFTAWH